ncbi:MAG: ABC transporter permease [Dehalococcoidia bacterium]|nr:ABC transporter permease [Dehalococcoidia bacterium]
MLTLLGASVKMVARDRQSIFWALAFPMIFLGVFRLFSVDSARTTALLVVADVRTEAGATLLAALQAVPFLDVEVRPGLSEDAALAVLQERKSDAALVLTAGAAGAPASAQLITAVNDPVRNAITVAAITSVVDRANLALTRAPQAIELHARSAGVHRTTYFEFLGPGIIGMGLMNFATIALAGSLSRYRSEGVLRRIRATPLAPWRFFTSVVGAHLLVAGVQVVVLALVAEALGAHVLRGGLPFLLVSLYGTLIFLNIGVIVAGKVQGRGAVEGAANAITLPMMFLSGSFFPTSSLPAAVRPIVEVLPLTQMLHALRGLALDGDSLLDHWPALLIMTAWVVGTLLIARVTFRFADD